ncbi:cytochrome-c oxidase, cbb3-type subunit III [Motiliproteus coralliicola]|uniref:Cbb3-type cytochrome c oxidase subunit n=1 Tax=Motiliproteus coralliicola TaxID=2283196 RepID=A0A369WTB1_9GAMM|nr:cytochrome-c oxidase, cbb3-type subunit III [Motiliproteus coralliicola]RDE24299.1 cytochrome-c oxidase, cbb3-type subunit III [Motiliproteus coralliicola]
MADEKNPFPGENNTGHIWDDNIRELDNPVPRWWMVGFWASVLWWVAYGILYPMIPLGEDSTKGVLGWTQIGEYNDGVAEVQAVRAKFEDQIAGMTPAEILADDGLSGYATASARVLFGDNCQACHGAGGQGGPGYPVLADDNWLYGGTIEAITQTITSGRQGIMVAHGATLSDQEIDTLAQYTVDLSQGQANEAGAELYQTKGCFACHGPDAKGLQIMGSANLTDAIWRFNEDDKLASAKYTIKHGVNAANDPMTREAVMPAFSARLSDNDIKKLAVYVHKLGGGQ